jgi:copper homeostasis protein
MEGGTTPSAGLIATVRDKIAIELYVMIRPRGGDFCYSEDEFQAMQQDVLTARHMGVDGVVLGILDENGQVNISRTRSLLELARPLKVTFHRAFDMSRDLGAALEDVILAGVDRVLTSGGEQNVEDGIPTLAQLVRTAKDRVIIMPGGGITETNVHRVITETSVREIHASIKVPVSSQMRYRNEKISMGSIPDREYQRFVVLEDHVQQLLRAALERNIGVAGSGS